MMFLIVALFALPAEAKNETPPPKGMLIDQLHEACLRNPLPGVKDQKSVCGCLKANYQKRLTLHDLNFLARVQTGNAGKNELAGKDDLLEFDMEAAQNCLEDSSWRWAPPKN